MGERGEGRTGEGKGGRGQSGLSLLLPGVHSECSSPVQTRIKYFNFILECVPKHTHHTSHGEGARAALRGGELPGLTQIPW